MNIQNFKQLLREMNSTEMSQCSVRNHHVTGLDYLCLHRSPRLTVKLYFIDPKRIEIEPGEFLVTPHTHRYAFESTVLSGGLTHIRFDEVYGEGYERAQYSPESRERMENGETGLFPRFENHGPSSTYFCTVDDIHTLSVPYAPVLLGLVQFADTNNCSTVYVRKGSTMEFPKSRAMRPAEAELLRRHALDLIQ